MNEAPPQFRLTPAQIASLEKMTDAVARHTLLLGGSQSGKTFIAVRAIMMRAVRYPGSRHLCLRLHRVTAEKYLWRQKLLEVVDKCFADIALQYNHSKMIVAFPNGSTVWFGGLDEGEKGDGLLGSNWNTILFDEANEMLAEMMQKARTRLSPKTRRSDGKTLCVNRTFATVNPTFKTHHLYRTYVEKFDVFRNLPMNPDVAALYNWIRVNPKDNLENLGQDYIRELSSLSDANRRRFLDGEWSEEAVNALFKLSDINRNRVATWEAIGRISFDRIVVGVDPAVTSGATADFTGIVVVGWTRPGSGDRRSSGQYYILEDRSIRGTPDEWAQAVVDAYLHWKADLIVGETNNGGDLVEKNLRSASRTIPFKKVVASRGKVKRAQHVVSLNEHGDLHVAVCLPELEGEMVGWDPLDESTSPDRLDAMVWAVTELSGMNIRRARSLGTI